MTDFTEADEIRVARKDPTARHLRGVSMEHALTARTDSTELTLILPNHLSPGTRETLLEGARRLLRARVTNSPFGYHFARFWFENQLTDQPSVDHTHGDVTAWSGVGEITFTDGTRLNDALLVRVTF